jgi:hypothetical protein
MKKYNPIFHNLSAIYISDHLDPVFVVVVVVKYIGFFID